MFTRIARANYNIIIICFNLSQAEFTSFIAILLHALHI